LNFFYCLQQEKFGKSTTYSATIEIGTTKPVNRFASFRAAFSGFSLNTTVHDERLPVLTGLLVQKMPLPVCPGLNEACQIIQAICVMNLTLFPIIRL